MTTNITLYDNTFITAQDADLYFQNRPNAAVWSSSSETEKDQALIFATMKINNFNFVGKKKLPSQNLEFPRNFDPELPTEIQNATCEEALAILENSPHSQNKRLGISSVSLGNSSVSYFEKEKQGGLLSPEAFSLVSRWTAKNFDIR